MKSMMNLRIINNKNCSKGKNNMKSSVSKMIVKETKRIASRQ